MVFNTLFPYYKQETNFACGATCMRTALAYFQIKKTEKQILKLFEKFEIPSSSHDNFQAVAEKFKLNYITFRNATINDLREYQKKGYIIIVCYYFPKEKFDHYSVLKNIDNENIYLYDPTYGPEKKYKLSYFQKVWKSDPRYDKNKEKHWFFGVSKVLK